MEENNNKIANSSNNLRKVNKKKNKNGKISKEESEELIFKNKTKVNNLASNYYNASRQIKQNKIVKPKNRTLKDISTDLDKSANIIKSNKLTLNKITDPSSTSNSKKTSRNLPLNMKQQNLKNEFIKNAKNENEKHNSIKSKNFEVNTSLNKSLVVQTQRKNSARVKSEISIKNSNNNSSNKNIIKKNYNKSYNLKKNKTNNKLIPKYLNLTNDDIIYEDPETTDFKVNDPKIKKNNLKKNIISKHLSHMNLLNVNKIHIKNNLTDDSKIIQKSTRAVSKKPTEKEKENKLKKLNRRNFGEVQKYTKKTAAFIARENAIKNEKLLHEIHNKLESQRPKMVRVKTNDDLFNNDDKIKNRKQLNRNYTNLYDKYQNKKNNEKKIKKKKNIITRTVTYQNFNCPNIKENNHIKNPNIKSKNHTNKILKPNKTKSDLNKKNNFNFNRVPRKSNILPETRGRSALINNKDKNNKSKNNNLRKSNKSIDIPHNKKEENDNNEYDIYELIRSKSTRSKNEEIEINIDNINDIGNDEEDIDTILYCEEKNLDESKIDKFDEVNSIVRYIDFDLVPISQISIFSVNSSKYNNYSQKFEEKFKKDFLEKKKDDKKENNLDQNEEKILFSDKSERTKDNSAQKISINSSNQYVENK